MSFRGTQVNKLNGGLGRFSTSDRVVCLIAGTVQEIEGAVELIDINDVEGYGITASTDDTNNELLYYHLSEMFRLAPESRFSLICVPKTTTVAQLVADEAVKTAIRNIPGCNVIGIAGLATPVANALVDAVALQSFVDAFANEYRYIDGIFVEGVGDDEGNDYGNLRSIEAPNISYVIAQDPAIAGMKSQYALHAAVGTALGSVAVRKIHEDIGSVDIEQKPRSRRGQENYSLSDSKLGRWLSAAFSDGSSFSEMSAGSQYGLTSSGFMYVGSFENYPGFYWNGCPTAVSADSDYAYFNFNCIWNKAARIIRNTLIPLVRSKVPTDPETGYLKSTWVSGCESKVKAALDRMIAEGNIEDMDVYINPAQTIGENNPLEIRCSLVVGRIVHEFSVDLGLVNNSPAPGPV